MRTLETSTHVVRRPVFPVERFGDEHLPEHGVDVENLVGGLICSHPGDAVSDGDVLVLVRADLEKTKRRNEPAGFDLGSKVSIRADAGRSFPPVGEGYQPSGEVKFNISVWEK